MVSDTYNSTAARPCAATPIKDDGTVIVFDWDDTLLASTLLAEAQYPACISFSQIPRHHQKLLRRLSKAVRSALSLALAHGRVIIVTNAESGWVEMSAKSFLPDVVPLLDMVEVLSARSMYEYKHAQDPMQWKVSCFRNLLFESCGCSVDPAYYVAPNPELLDLSMGSSLSDSMCSTDSESSFDSDIGEMKPVRQVISFGDSQAERFAAQAVTKELSSELDHTVTCKSVKFVERPNLEQLIRQLDLVKNCFGYVISHQRDLDLMLTVTESGE